MRKVGLVAKGETDEVSVQQVLEKGLGVGERRHFIPDKDKASLEA